MGKTAHGKRRAAALREKCAVPEPDIGFGISLAALADSLFSQMVRHGAALPRVRCQAVSAERGISATAVISTMHPKCSSVTGETTLAGLCSPKYAA